ncbi:MAG: hypothetical protein MGG37_06550 [Trichodesmium sp. MAG_R01]|nr:hypothetical protein [Trichodesmium sp. MAG_R01]
MLDKLPPQEQASGEWSFLLAKTIGLLFINTLIANRGNYGDEGKRDDVVKYIFEVISKEKISTKIRVIAKVSKILLQLLIKGVSKDFHEIDDLLFSLIKKNDFSIFSDILGRAVKLLMEE